MLAPTPRGEVERLLGALIDLRARVVDEAQREVARYARCLPDGPTLGALNLAHYLALRRIDLRPLQASLATHGLSSLGRSESHVLASLDQVIHALLAMTGRRTGPGSAAADDRFEAAASALSRHADALFGPPPSGRDVRIMVTLPSEAAWDRELVTGLVAAGMDCARVNCVHDGKEAWLAMIRHVREAVQQVGRPCRVQMDLAGYKLRTGPIALKPPVMRVRPERDGFGRVVTPARVELVEESVAGSLPDAPARLVLPRSALERLRVGDRLRFLDARGKRRALHVVGEGAGGFLAHCKETSYLTPDTVFRLEDSDAQGERGAPGSSFCAAGFSRSPVEIRLFRGDRLLLRRGGEPGEPARRGPRGELVAPAHVSCVTPRALDRVVPGQAVWIDDGKLGGVIESVDQAGALVRIDHSRPQGVRLRADKGLNFPGATLGLPSLSEKDLADLEVVVAQADLVGFSFVETGEDMEALMKALADRGAPELAIVAKIETERAVRHLPDILFSAVGRRPLGVMIARGDLAVELGGERLAEIQEEILWLCEAAHVPAIWATQVLETLTRKGVVSRPELTDAAMSGRAECVMLNKGPYILDAVRTLDDILRRMQEHQRKKTSKLRALKLAAPHP